MTFNEHFARGMESKLDDITTQIKIAFLEEIIGINEIDFDNVPIALVDYYIELKVKEIKVR